MATSSTTFPIPASSQKSCTISSDCATSADEFEDGRFFRGVMIAVPAGLAMWVGILKVAVMVFRHY